MSSASSLLPRVPAIRVLVTLVLFLCLQGEARGKDVIPPGTTTDLTITDHNPFLATLTVHWTLSGDDACIGQATSYSLRKRFDEEITEANWATSTVVNDNIPGTTDHYTDENWWGTGSHYYALKATDDAGNQSGISNWVLINWPYGGPGDQGPLDVCPPATTTDLHITAYTTSPRSVTLQWSPSGDDGTVGQPFGYIVKKRLGQEITEENWPTSSYVDALIPVLPGDATSVYVTGLSGNGYWYFALKTTDEVCNLSGVSNNDCIKFSPSPMALCDGSKPVLAQEESAPGGELAITAVRSNPASESGVEVSFTLASGPAATLAVFDAAGRRVEAQDLSRLSPGNNSVRIGASLAAGHYWVRIDQGNRSATRDVTVVH